MSKRAKTAIKKSAADEKLTGKNSVVFHLNVMVLIIVAFVNIKMFGNRKKGIFL